MVARTQPDVGLIVSFYREGEPVESLSARDGTHAWEHAIHMVTKRETLLPGDALIIRRADDELEAWAHLLRGAA